MQKDPSHISALVPIAVEARFNPDGSLQPLAFEYKGRRYQPLSHGRQWEQDGRKHFLVMTPGREVFEICYLPSQAQWRLVRLPRDFSPDRRIV